MHVNKLLSAPLNRQLHAVVTPPRSPRGTGRTTAIALRMIASGLKNQGWVITDVDHLGGTSEQLYSTVLKLCKQLELKEVSVVCLASGTVTFQSNIWE